MPASIDEVHWKSLRANGDPARVPFLLRALMATEKSKRAAAWGELVDLINHQGDVYSATIEALRCLFSLARDGSVPPSEVLEFASGFFDPAGEYPGELGENLRHVFSEALPIVFRSLFARDPVEREVSALILGNLPQLSMGGEALEGPRRGAQPLLQLHEQSLVELQRAIASERESAPLALAIWAFGSLRVSDPPTEMFLQTAQQANDALVRAVAAAFVARWRGRDAEEFEVRVVADAMARRLGATTKLPFGFFEESLKCPLGGHLVQQIRTGRYVAT